MTYDGLVLAAVAAELKRTVETGRIQQVRQHDASDLTLEVRSRDGTFMLFLSVHARFSRVHWTASKLPVPQSPPNFCMLLRKHLGGAFIKSVEQVGFDRILKIHTEAPDGNRNTLILELMGKHSNLILVSDTGRILGAVKHIGTTVSRYRQVLPGRDYIPPPGGEKLDLLTVSRAEFDALWRDGIGPEVNEDTAKRWLVAGFSGIGPYLAEEIVVRSGAATPDAIWDGVAMIRQIVLERDFAPVLITNDRGASVYAYPIPTVQYPPANQHERASMNEVLDTLYRDLVRRDAFDGELTGLETAIRRSIAGRKQTIKQLEEAVREGEKAERYQQLGELILATAHAIPKSASSAKVVDYYDPEQREVEIKLDDKLSVHQNAERYFNRARKAREGAEQAADRLKDMQSEADILQMAFDKLPNATDVASLKAVRQMLTERGLLRHEAQPVAPGKREVAEFGTAKIRRVKSVDGFEILYGENSTSNDYLTTKVAKPNDYWFHARSVTGAHVVIRTANKPGAVPPSTIREAAVIAARNSDAKHSSLVAVDYTLRKFVRKPRTAAPGLVTYQNEKTVDISPGL